MSRWVDFSQTIVDRLTSELGIGGPTPKAASVTFAPSENWAREAALAAPPAVVVVWIDSPAKKRTNFKTKVVAECEAIFVVYVWDVTGMSPSVAESYARADQLLQDVTAALLGWSHTFLGDNPRSHIFLERQMLVEQDTQDGIVGMAAIFAAAPYWIRQE